jgi:hypothetical protein
MAIDTQAHAHAARSGFEMDVGCASRNCALEHLVDPANDGRSAGEITQALEVGVRAAGLGGGYVPLLSWRHGSGNEPDIDFAADADGRPYPQSGFQRDRRYGLGVEGVCHDKLNRPVSHAQGSDALRTQIVRLQQPVERGIRRKSFTRDKGKVAGHRQGLCEMLFVHETELQKELVHPFGGMLRHRDGAGVLLLMSQLTASVTCWSERSLLVTVATASRPTHL